jgi:hypothetical protein
MSLGERAAKASATKQSVTRQSVCKHSSHVKTGMHACSGGQAVPNHRSKRVAS